MRACEGLRCRESGNTTFLVHGEPELVWPRVMTGHIQVPLRSAHLFRVDFGVDDAFFLADHRRVMRPAVQDGIMPKG